MGTGRFRETLASLCSQYAHTPCGGRGRQGLRTVTQCGECSCHKLSNTSSAERSSAFCRPLQIQVTGCEEETWGRDSDTVGDHTRAGATCLWHSQASSQYLELKLKPLLEPRVCWRWESCRVPTALLGNECSPEVALLWAAANITMMTALPQASEALFQEQTGHSWISGQEAGRCPKTSIEWEGGSRGSCQEQLRSTHHTVATGRGEKVSRV